MPVGFKPVGAAEVGNQQGPQRVAELVRHHTQLVVAQLQQDARGRGRMYKDGRLLTLGGAALQLGAAGSRGVLE